VHQVFHQQRHDAVRVDEAPGGSTAPMRSASPSVASPTQYSPVIIVGDQRLQVTAIGSGGCR
jgi:hypothetical protein